MKKTWLPIALVVLLITSFLSNPAYAKIGVGIGTGKIRVDEILKPGTIYQLPSLSVVNTGDLTSSYEVSMSYNEEQKELRPDQKWVKFTPSVFELEPGEVKIVSITLDLPIKTVPGKYFAYLQASPVQKNESGESSVGIAAAAKFYYEVAPANVFVGIYYRLLSLWNLYSPWTERVAGVIALAVVYFVGRKYINIEIKPRKSNDSNKG